MSLISTLILFYPPSLKSMTQTEIWSTHWGDWRYVRKPLWDCFCRGCISHKSRRYRARSSVQGPLVSDAPLCNLLGLLQWWGSYLLVEQCCLWAHFSSRLHGRLVAKARRLPVLPALFLARWHWQFGALRWNCNLNFGRILVRLQFLLFLAGNMKQRWWAAKLNAQYSNWQAVVAKYIQAEAGFKNNSSFEEIFLQYNEMKYLYLSLGFKSLFSPWNPFFHFEICLFFA